MPEKKITDFGRRILQACPSADSTGIDERTLIEQLQGLSAYADYQRGIRALVDASYLVQDPVTHRYKRAADKKKTILHLPSSEAQAWCFGMQLRLEDLWLREMAFRDASSKFAAQTLQVMLSVDGRRTANPHLKRARELRTEDCALTHDILFFISNLSKTLRGERRVPFEDEQISQDEARSWVTSMRTRLKAKIRREQRYRDVCAKTHERPYKEAATEEDSAWQQEIVLLLDELLKTYPPKRLPRSKKK